MFYRLTEKFALRGWQDRPYVLLQQEDGWGETLTREQFLLLQACDGKQDLQPQELLSQLLAKGVIAPCAAGAKPEPGQAYRQYPNPYVQTVQWAVTGRCNYRCKHCYVSAPENRFGEPSHEQCLAFISQLADCGVGQISLTGGEPLLRKDFLELIDALLAAGIRITILFTNGKLVTKELLAALARRNCRPEFNMSFDGLGWHDWLRGASGAEEATLAAFRLCRELGFPTGAEMCLHRGNLAALGDSIQALAEAGCTRVKTNPIAATPLWQPYVAEYGLTIPELYQAYLDYIPRYYREGMPTDVTLGCFFQARRGRRRYGIPAAKFSSRPDALTQSVCRHARSTLFIGADGRMLPCMPLASQSMGETFPNVYENGLADGLMQPAYRQVLDVCLAELLARNQQCGECRFRLMCGGGCRALALEGPSRDYFGPDPFACAVYQGDYIPRICTAADQALAQFCPDLP